MLKDVPLFSLFISNKLTMVPLSQHNHHQCFDVTNSRIFTGIFLHKHKNHFYNFLCCFVFHLVFGKFFFSCYCAVFLPIIIIYCRHSIGTLQNFRVFHASGVQNFQQSFLNPLICLLIVLTLPCKIRNVGLSKSYGGLSGSKQIRCHFISQLKSNVKFF